MISKQAMNELITDIKFTDLIKKTQDEVFGSDFSQSKINALYDDFLAFLHAFKKNTANKNKNDVEVYIFNGQAPVCPICKRPIAAIRTFSDIKQDNNHILTKCPVGHSLVYNVKKGILEVKQIDEDTDMVFKKAKKDFRLTAVWGV